MMTDTGKLDRTLQALVDERLDAIERVLQGAGVSRAERQGIIEEVEAQVHELLSRRGSEPTSADVVAVLDSLDPPEAYAPEGAPPRRPTPTRPRVPQPCPLALTSAAGALVFLFLVLLVFELSSHHSEGMVALVFFLSVLAGGAVCALGVWSIRRIRASGGWSTGLPFALFGALAFPLVVTNLLVLFVLELFEGRALILLAALMFVAGNVSVVRRVWHWVSADYRPALRAGEPATREP